MKKFLTITVIALFMLLGMSINVQASEVSTWEDLKTELASGTDSLVVLNDSVTITGIETLNLNQKEVQLKQPIVVDGGSLTITGNGTIFTDVAEPNILVKPGSELIVKNGLINSATGTGGVGIKIIGSEIDNGVKTKVTIMKDAIVTANYPVMITSNNTKSAYGVQVDVYGSLNGTTENNGWNYGSVGIYINGNVQATTGNVPVINIYEGASLVTREGTSGNVNDDDAPAIYAAGFAKWNISGGYLQGSEALSIKGGEFNITGGTFVAIGEYNPGSAYGNGSEATGSAISITGNKNYAGNIVLEISNASVRSENAYAIYEVETNKGEQPAVNNLEIISGTYSGKIADIDSENLKNFVKGGIYSNQVNEKYLSTTVGSVEQDGIVLVGTKNPIIIKPTVNGTIIASLAEGIAGQTILLTITPVEGYKLGQLKAYDANNNEIPISDMFVMPNSEVTIEAEFEKIEIALPEDDEEDKKDENIEETTGTVIQQPETDEKDNTPKTGFINIQIFIWIAILAMILIVITKK